MPILAKKNLSCFLLMLSLSFAIAAEPGPDIHAEKLFKEAAEAFNTRELDESEKLCKRILEDHPNHSDANNLLGSILLHKREFKQAREFFAIAQKAEPNNSYIAFNIAEIDFVTKDWEKAKERFTDILDDKELKDSFKSVVQFKLITIAYQQNDIDAITKHHDVFKNANMEMELDYCAILKKIHNTKPNKKEAQKLWIPLRKKYKKSEPYVDSIIESYYMED